MGILRDIIDSLEGDAPVKDVRLGVFYGAVVSRGCGLALTASDHVSHNQVPSVKESGRLMEHSALELTRLATMHEPLGA